ncbi:MAG: class I SAM-dependent methyltransferase [Gammaproteobacteria bacterium]|nr:MAG: class I SAM-dependent methyltransferase [Gammaproteobacteria bacterium]
MRRNPSIKQVQIWKKSSLATIINHTEKQAVNNAINSIPGIRILQIGVFNENEHLSVNRKNDYFIMDPFDNPSSKVTIVASPRDLPFQNETIDIVILLHTLEFSNNPQQALHEAERVLCPDGHIIVIGFNPLSIAGIKSLMPFQKSHYPWCGKYLSCKRVSEWFAVLGMEIMREQKYINNTQFNIGLKFCRWNKISDYTDNLLSCFGQIYIIMARKKLYPMSLLRSRWLKRKRKIITGGVVQPSPKSTKELVNEECYSADFNRKDV